MSYPPAPGLGLQATAIPGIPKCFLKVIGDLESDIDWCINGNASGVSLTLRFPAKSPKGRRSHRRHLGNPVNTDTLSSRKQDHAKTSSCAILVNAPIHGDVKPKSKKSPSCKQRDRNRRKRWRRKRKSLANRLLDKQPCESSLRVEANSTVGQDNLIADANCCVGQDSLYSAEPPNAQVTPVQLQDDCGEDPVCSHSHSQTELLVDPTVTVSQSADSAAPPPVAESDTYSDRDSTPSPSNTNVTPVESHKKKPLPTPSTPERSLYREATRMGYDQARTTHEQLRRFGAAEKHMTDRLFQLRRPQHSTSSVWYAVTRENAAARAILVYCSEDHGFQTDTRGYYDTGQLDIVRDVSHHEHPKCKALYTQVAPYHESKVFF
jgi:hypothetical protein